MTARVTKANGATRPLTAGDRPSLSAVSTTTRRLPNRVLVYAPEGWGKTSFAAHAPGCIFLCTKGEDGLEKLIETGQVGETAHFLDQARTWADVTACVDDLVAQDHPYKVLVLDTINGAVQLLLRQTVRDDFAGNEAKAAQFGGVELAKLATVRLLDLMARLDRLREARRMSVLLLGHAEVVKFTNPEGPDYDRWQPAIERKHLWPELARWLDVILFGCFETFAEKEKGSRGKARGGQVRLMHSERHAAYDAKNRHGMPAEIECGETPAETWAAFMVAMKQGKE